MIGSRPMASFTTCFVGRFLSRRDGFEVRILREIFVQIDVANAALVAADI